MVLPPRATAAACRCCMLLLMLKLTLMPTRVAPALPAVAEMQHPYPPPIHPYPPPIHPLKTPYTPPMHPLCTPYTPPIGFFTCTRRRWAGASRPMSCCSTRTARPRRRTIRRPPRRRTSP